MAVSFPQLDIYYIELAEDQRIALKEQAKAGRTIGRVGNCLVRAFVPGGALIGELLDLGISLTPYVMKSLKRLINEKKFYVITSRSELNRFENACGNEWVTNQKSMKQKQYYIRHPKKTNRNVLVEAKSFYDYIEEEQKDELIDFILSHCPAKQIKIERIEVVRAKGKASAKVRAVDAHGGLEASLSKSDIYNYEAVANYHDEKLENKAQRSNLC